MSGKNVWWQFVSIRVGIDCRVADDLKRNEKCLVNSIPSILLTDFNLWGNVVYNNTWWRAHVSTYITKCHRSRRFQVNSPKPIRPVYLINDYDYFANTVELGILHKRTYSVFFPLVLLILAQIYRRRAPQSYMNIYFPT